MTALRHARLDGVVLLVLSGVEGGRAAAGASPGAAVLLLVLFDPG